ncbi:GntP family permease [Nocardioides sp. B-3]|uniref:GntP family permease n=1 Tax=Nocardioides sp. B-3 TaxID=2895565 RepID=UPI0021529029|nr:SLC13 family permease [Nocardioides sp. B-3]UUZ59007.1 hypothetical protein LP418_23920 [Nocardioides sp. B-3]
MENLEPAYSTPVLLLIAAAAVGLLLLLVMKVRLHAFIALVLVSLVTAVAAGIPIAQVPAALLAGFGTTLGSVALPVGFGVMLGRLPEVTGGARVLADSLINRFGEARAPFALGVAALIFGFPIFFDAGLVVFLPIILTVARRFGGSVLYYALPAAGAFAAMHAIVPPHPGPVAAGTALGADIGVVLLIGVPVAVASLVRRRLPRLPVPGGPLRRARPDSAVRRGQRRRGCHRAPGPGAAGLRDCPRPAAGPALPHLVQHRPDHPRHQRHPCRGPDLGSRSSSSWATLPSPC